MEQFEIDQVQVQLANERQILAQMLNVIDTQRGKLTESQELTIFNNLVELQDDIRVLLKDSGYYQDTLEDLIKFSKLGHKVLKDYPKLALADVLRKTLREVDRYIRQSGYYPKYDQEYPEKYYEEKTSKELIQQRTKEELMRQLDTILKDVSDEIKQDMVKKARGSLLPNMTILELTEEEAKTIDAKLKLTANTMIIDYYKRRF